MKISRSEKIFFSLTVILRFCYRANKQRFKQFIQSFNIRLYKIEQNTFDDFFEQSFHRYL